MRMTILTMAALFTLQTVALAADDADAVISVRQIKSGEKQALIRVANLTDQSPAILKIKNMDGVTLHREVITDQAYMKKYDFSGLPSGKYEVEVKTKNGVSKEVFQITEGQQNALYFKPAIQIEPDMVKVAFINKIATPLSLKLYSDNGRVLYEEKVDSQQTYSKGLNVSKLQPGHYSISLVGDNYTYSRDINLY